jgi:hypothetical protein
MSLEAQSADTFRKGSTGTCECTRLRFASATEYFLVGACGDNAKLRRRGRSGREFCLKIK